ncbi:hypothetical protein Pint_36686 [Pistacia integerrima]|uniref:Uncharacterized protein n=1 Tax=Pistacia integerrima TaxID=434235 RepID=A0ACC0Y482_9ROSI|nr:hypothetical protein Pint_36686 [Pistacia integerrima]
MVLVNQQQPLDRPSKTSNTTQEQQLKKSRRSTSKTPRGGQKQSSHQLIVRSKQDTRTASKETIRQGLTPKKNFKVKIEASCYLSKRRPVETGEVAVGGDWRSFNQELQKIHIPWISKTWSCVCGSEIGDAVMVETVGVALESADWRSGDGGVTWVAATVTVDLREGNSTTFREYWMKMVFPQIQPLLQLQCFFANASQLSIAISPLPLHPPKSHFSTRTQMKTKTTPSLSNSSRWGGRRLRLGQGGIKNGLVVDGKLWVWGKGDGGRLGFGHENSVFVLSLNPYLGDDPVQCVALGGVHSVALTSLGKIFTWGYGAVGALGHAVYHRELFPRLVEGELYTWGRDEGDGRLGLGLGGGPNEGGGLSILSKVKALPSTQALFLVVAFLQQGLERGRATLEFGRRPKPIPSLEDVRIIQIASGGYHSLALTDEGKVLSWGYGGHGQLGHSSTENRKVPVVIEALADERAFYIACGGSSSAAITGKLYMWGNAKDSQIGVPGLPEVQPCPVEVKFLMEDDGLEPTRCYTLRLVHLTPCVWFQGVAMIINFEEASRG